MIYAIRAHLYVCLRPWPWRHQRRRSRRHLRQHHARHQPRGTRAPGNMHAGQPNGKYLCVLGFHSLYMNVLVSELGNINSGTRSPGYMHEGRPNGDDRDFE